MSKTIPLIRVTSFDRKEGIEGELPAESDGGRPTKERNSQDETCGGEERRKGECWSDEEDEEERRVSAEVSCEYFPPASGESESNQWGGSPSQRSVIYTVKPRRRLSSVSLACLTDLEAISTDEELDQEDEEDVSSGALCSSKATSSAGFTRDNDRRSSTGSAASMMDNRSHSNKDFVMRRRSVIDGFTSDVEDSDSSLPDGPFNKKHSFPNSNRHFSTQPVLRKRNKTLLSNTKPLESAKNKVKLSTNEFKVKIGHECVNRTKLTKFKKKSLSPMKTKNACCYIDENGSLTDVEEFGRGGEDKCSDDDKKIIEFIPAPKREITLANQGMKGEVALIFPISKPTNIKMAIRMEGFDCGFSDNEDLPGYEEEDMKICLTPEPPLMEASYVKTKETFKDSSKLLVMIENYETHTDTEEIHVAKESVKHTRYSYMNVSKHGSTLANVNGNVSLRRRKVKNRLEVSDIPNQTSDIEDNGCGGVKQKKKSSWCSGLGEGTTDVEDFDEDPVRESLARGDMRKDDTESEEISGGDGEGEDSGEYREPEVVSSWSVTREREGPTSRETRRRLMEGMVGELGRRTPSAPPSAPTSQEEELSSAGEEEEEEEVAGARLDVPPHRSVVHVSHTRLFRPRLDELKPAPLAEPLTDLEDLDH